MLILTNENETYNTDLAAVDVNNTRYCALDMSVPKNADFYFYPLVFLESFNSPAIVLNIGPYTITLPYDWYFLAGDPTVGDYELVSFKDWNDRDFTVPVMNPLSSFIPKHYPISIADSYNEVRWYFPKLNMYNILVVPLEVGKNPQCCFFVNDAGGRKMDKIDSSIFYS